MSLYSSMTSTMCSLIPSCSATHSALLRLARARSFLRMAWVCPSTQNPVKKLTPSTSTPWSSTTLAASMESRPPEIRAAARLGAFTSLSSIPIDAILLPKAKEGLLRALLQRVSEAAVSIAGRETARIDHGLLIFVAVVPGRRPRGSPSDWPNEPLAARVFPDGNKAMNRSVLDIGGAVLAVSQFTLAADHPARATDRVSGPPHPRHKRRNSTSATSMRCGKTARLSPPASSVADMQVSLVNDGTGDDSPRRPCASVGDGLVSCDGSPDCGTGQARPLRRGAPGCGAGQRRQIPTAPRESAAWRLHEPPLHAADEQFIEFLLGAGDPP